MWFIHFSWKELSLSCSELCIRAQQCSRHCGKHQSIGVSLIFQTKVIINKFRLWEEAKTRKTVRKQLEITKGWGGWDNTMVCWASRFFNWISHSAEGVNTFLPHENAARLRAVMFWKSCVTVYAEGLEGSEFTVMEAKLCWSYTCIHRPWTVIFLFHSLILPGHHHSILRKNEVQMREEEGDRFGG
jgi:hypothetical protein